MHPDQPGWPAGDVPGEGAPAPYQGQDDLHFRLKVLERIGLESSPEAKLALIRLLDGEGDRGRTIAEAEVQAGIQVEVQALEVQRARAQAETTLQQEKIQADTAADQRKDQALRHVSWRSTVTTISPVIFAVLVAVFMFLFWKWQQPDAAGAFEKILVMVITGGLGWAAGRTQVPGGARREDRPVPRPGEGPG
jgi:hypothetical protein